MCNDFVDIYNFSLKYPVGTIQVGVSRDYVASLQDPAAAVKSSTTPHRAKTPNFHLFDFDAPPNLYYN